MLKEPTEAKSTGVKFFFSGEDAYAIQGKDMYDDINDWLMKQSPMTHVHDIQYKHLISSDASKGVVSVMIVYTL